MQIKTPYKSFIDLQGVMIIPPYKYTTSQSTKVTLYRKLNPNQEISQGAFLGDIS